MTAVTDIMSTDVRTIEPQQSLRVAAQMMKELDVGALPVCDGRRLLGMVTDRDIALRAVAEGLAPDAACVSDIMTPDIAFCSEDDDAEDVMKKMGERQIRRLPVLNRSNQLVGIVSLGDLATRQSADIDDTVREISEPGSSPV